MSRFGVTSHHRSCLGAWLLLLSVAGAGCIPVRTVENGRLNKNALEKTFAGTEKLRGLKRTAEVPSKAVGRKQVAAVLADYSRDHAAATRSEQLLHRKLGILPPVLARESVTEKMMEGPVAGFYIPDSKQLFVISDYSAAVRLQMDLVGMLNGTDFGYDMILSHEIAHALQDQHYDLMQLDETGRHDNTDRSLAFVSLVESDANVVGFAYSHAMDPRGDIKRAILHGYIRLNYWLNLPLIPLLAPGVPAFYRSVSFGHYVRGMPLVDRALASGGWSKLDRVYREALPQSTEQVMFPEKYYGPDCDPPVELPSMATPTALAGAMHGWTSTFGALQLKALLDHHGAWWWQSDALARAWGGDRFTLWKSPHHIALVWRTVWDDEDAAKEFAQRWSDQLSRRYFGVKALRTGSSPNDLPHRWRVAPTSPPSPNHIRVKAPEGIAIERRGRRVVIVEGVAVAALDAVVKQTWAALPASTERKRSGRCPGAELLHAEIPSEGPSPSLADRVFLPHRTIYFSVLNSWSSVRSARLRGTRRGAMRWALRDGFVWETSSNTLSLRALQSPLLVSVSMRPSLSALDFGASAAWFVTEDLALLAEAQSYRPWSHAASAVDPDFQTLGLLWRPMDRVVISLSALWLREAAAMDPGGPERRPARRFAIGSPLGIAGNGLPLVEWRLHDAAWLFWDPLVLLDAAGKIEAHSHRFGIGLYL